MIRRNVTTLGQQVHTIQYRLRLFEISGGSISTAEPCERVRSFAHQLDTPFSRLNRLRVTTESTQHETRAVERHQISWLVFEGRARKTISLVKTARVIRAPDHRKTRDDGERIEIATGVCFAERLAEPSLHRELQRIPDARRRVVRIELDRAYEMMLRTAPGEVAAKDRLSERNVTFREIWIDLNRGRGRFVSRCRTLGKRHHTEHAEPVVIVGDAGMRERVFRIERDCLLITDDRARKTFFSKRVPVKTSAQVSFVRLWIVCAALGESQSLVHSQVRHDRFRDVRRDDVFKVENVCKLLVKLSGPCGRLVANVE